jgi:hypothetical protein
VIGNAQLARLLKGGPPTAKQRGASPATIAMMRVASREASTDAGKLSRCQSGGKAGCTCAACSDEGLEEELGRRR